MGRESRGAPDSTNHDLTSEGAGYHPPVAGPFCSRYDPGMEYLLGILPVIGALLVGGLIGAEIGKNRGYKAGHRDGWTERHNESTEEERAAWRARSIPDYYQRPVSGPGTSSQQA